MAYSRLAWPSFLDTSSGTCLVRLPRDAFLALRAGQHVIFAGTGHPFQLGQTC